MCVMGLFLRVSRQMMKFKSFQFEPLYKAIYNAFQRQHERFLAFARAKKGHLNFMPEVNDGLIEFLQQISVKFNAGWKKARQVTGKRNATKGNESQLKA